MLLILFVQEYLLFTENIFFLYKKMSLLLKYGLILEYLSALYKNMYLVQEYGALYKNICFVRFVQKK